MLFMFIIGALSLYFLYCLRNEAVLQKKKYQHLKEQKRTIFVSTLIASYYNKSL